MDGAALAQVGAHRRGVHLPDVPPEGVPPRGVDRRGRAAGPSAREQQRHRRVLDAEALPVALLQPEGAVAEGIGEVLAALGEAGEFLGEGFGAGMEGDLARLQQRCDGMGAELLAAARGDRQQADQENPSADRASGSGVAHFSCRRPQVVAGDNLGALTGQLGCRESAKGVDAGQ